MWDRTVMGDVRPWYICPLVHCTDNWRELQWNSSLWLIIKAINERI